jgi:hypothetical protein
VHGADEALRKGKYRLEYRYEEGDKKRQNLQQKVEYELQDAIDDVHR